MPMIMATCRRGSARAVAMHCDRRAFIAIVGGSILAAPLAGEAQQTGKAYRVGLFASAPIPDNLHAFRNGLRALGYVEANNVVMEQRYGVGKMPLSTAATEILGAQPDVPPRAAPGGCKVRKLASVDRGLGHHAAYLQTPDERPDRGRTIRATERAPTRRQSRTLSVGFDEATYKRARRKGRPT